MKKFNLYDKKADDLYKEYGKDGKKVHVVMDCENGELYVMSRPSTSTKMQNLGSFRLEGTWYFDVRAKLKKAIGFICKGSAIKKFGKQVVDYTPVFTEKDNPHFSCAEPMKIYAVPMLAYVDRELKRQV